MADINTATWQESAASNNSAAPDGAPEGMSYASVNDTIRENMGAVKRDWNRSRPVYSSGGTATAITLTFTVALTTYVQGMQVAFKVTTTSGDAATLNVNGLGAKKIYAFGIGGAAQVRAGAILAGSHVVLTYDTALDGGAGGWILWDTLQTGWNTISRVTTAGSQTVIDVLLPAGFEAFQLMVRGLAASGTPDLRLRFSTDNGASFVSGATDYSWGLLDVSTGPVARGSSETTNFIALHSSMPGTLASGLSGIVHIHGAADAAMCTTVNSHLGWMRSGIVFGPSIYSGGTSAAAVHNAVRLLNSGGAAFVNGAVVTLLGLR